MTISHGMAATLCAVAICAAMPARRNRRPRLRHREVAEEFDDKLKVLQQDYEDRLKAIERRQQENAEKQSAETGKARQRRARQRNTAKERADKESTAAAARAKATVPPARLLPQAGRPSIPTCR